MGITVSRISRAHNPKVAGSNPAPAIYEFPDALSLGARGFSLSETGGHRSRVAEVGRGVEYRLDLVGPDALGSARLDVLDGVLGRGVAAGQLLDALLGGDDGMVGVVVFFESQRLSVEHAGDLFVLVFSASCSRHASPMDRARSRRRRRSRSGRRAGRGGERGLAGRALACALRRPRRRAGWEPGPVHPSVAHDTRARRAVLAAARPVRVARSRRPVSHAVQRRPIELTSNSRISISG